MKNYLKALSRAQVALIIYSVIFFAFLVAFRIKFHFPNPEHSVSAYLASFTFFDRFAVEYLTITLIATLLIEGVFLLRLAGYLIFSFFSLLNLVQLVALARGHQFVSVLALENIGHISILVNAGIIIGGILLLLAYVAIPFGIERLSNGSRTASWKSIAKRSLALIILLLTIQQSRIWMPKSAFAAREKYFMANNLIHTSPTLALHKTFFGKAETIAPLSEKDAQESRKFGITIDLSKPYPFVSDVIYQGALPFARSFSETELVTKPNVIVFFTEGFSARTIGSYGSKYSDISPNIDRFTSESMQVLNYYNHTAATYRGLLGQYCSMFPTYGASENWDENKDKLPQGDKYCVNRVLNKSGYKTYFFDSHIKDAAYVDDMMESLGIDSVLTAENLSADFLNHETALRSDSMTDNQFMNGFIGWLKAGESRVGTDRPFMAGLYNLGTHAWRDVLDDGVKYREGQNTALNAVHNWDFVFGKFWDYFKSSPYAKNTIVILTSDHSHYTEDAYVAAMEGVADYQPFFVDRIPLVIYDPTHELPKTYDANYSTSIDFAPSLVHLLELPNSRNPFLGTSIFVHDKEYAGMGLASIGTDTFIVNKETIHHKINKTNMIDQIAVAERILNFTKHMETSNHIWNSAWNDEEASASAPTPESSIINEPTDSHQEPD